MTTYTWIGGPTGAWDLAGNWSPAGGPPNAFGDEADIPAGTTTVTITGAAYTVGILQMAAGTTLALATGATLTLYPPDGSADTTNLSGTISVDATSALQFTESWTTAQLGTISAVSGATLFFENGLDNDDATLTLAAGVIVKGEIDGGVIRGEIDPGAGSLTLADGPTLEGADGTSAALLQDTGNGSTLRLKDSETIANATINIGDDNHGSFITLYDSTGNGQLVTLASDVTVNVAYFAVLGGGSYPTDALDNKGTIDVTGTGGFLTISNPTFTNDGTITVANGDFLGFGNNSAFTNNGTISVDATSSVQFLGLTTAQLGTLIAAPADASAGTPGATIDFAGTGLNNTGAVFTPVNGVNYEGTITGGTIDGGLILGAFETLGLAGSPDVTGPFGTGQGFIDDANGGSTLALDSTQTIDNVTILLGNSYLTQADDDTVTTFGPNVTIDILGSATIDGAQTGAGIVNQGVIDDSLNETYPAIYGISFTNEGSMTFSNHDGFVVDNSVTFKNAVGGTITASAGANGQSYIEFQTDVENDGTITVDGVGFIQSEIDYYYSVTGTGTTDITGGGLADFFQSMTQQSTFIGAGELQLNSNVNSGVVSDFGAGDSINLTALLWDGTTTTTSLDATTNVLTVTEGSLSSAIQLDPGGNFAGYVFTLADDNSGLSGGDGTIVTVVPCFCRGTRIATGAGEVAVEDLRVGDLVATASGALRPVRWIGHRSLDTARHPSPRDVHPVRVRRGAFGEARPHRDLWLSPGHNIACDGVLITAAALLNGVSVEQIAQRYVEYWHVELDTHDILIAEGLWVESYLESGNRGGFDNGGAMVEAHPDFKPRRQAPTCLPLLEQGPQVERVRAQLRALLLAHGYGLTQEAQAFVEADGARVEPIALSPTRLAFVAPKGARALTLVSKTFVPLHTMADAPDDRELGLCINRVQIDGDTLALDRDDAPGPGWHKAEAQDGAFAHRWTTGAASLPAGARVIVVDLAGQGLYWREPMEAAVLRTA